MKKTLIIILSGVLSIILAFNCFVLAADNALTSTELKIHVDIPVIIKKAKVVFDIGHVSLSGDMPIALRFMSIMAKTFKEKGTEGQIIAEFYADAGYLLLNDQAYNARRHISTGNPYKGLIADLMTQGVQIEECAMTMKLQQIRNEDLLQGVKVNSGANLRMVQLMQEGFLRLQP